MDFIKGLLTSNILRLALIVCVCLVVSLIARKFLGDDNVIEETAEDIVKQQTGLDVDFSPENPEKKVDNAS